MTSTTTPAESTDRTALLARIGLVILAVQGLGTGLWATIAPRSVFDDFPGLEMAWVAPDGPSNEHLMRDSG